MPTKRVVVRRAPLRRVPTRRVPIGRVSNYQRNNIPSSNYVYVVLLVIISVYCCYLDTSRKQNCYSLVVALRFSAARRDGNDVSALRIIRFMSNVEWPIAISLRPICEHDGTASIVMMTPFGNHSLRFRSRPGDTIVSSGAKSSAQITTTYGNW